jgi:hypothetical protein
MVDFWLPEVMLNIGWNLEREEAGTSVLASTQLEYGQWHGQEAEKEVGPNTHYCFDTDLKATS